MLAATVVGIILIPGLYVMFQYIGDFCGGKRVDHAEPDHVKDPLA